MLIHNLSKCQIVNEVHSEYQAERFEPMGSETLQGPNVMTLSFSNRARDIREQVSKAGS
jgi:hypothetical protein